MFIQQSDINVSFSGTIPFNYEEYVGSLFFEPFAVHISEEIKRRAPASLLEVAAGTGRLTKHLRNSLPEHTAIIASDVNPAMIEQAKEKVSDVRWETLDAEMLPFANDQFDCIVSQFGVMYYNDKVRAYKEAYRTLRLNGVFIFSCWDDLKFNIAADITDRAAAKFFPVNPPVFYRRPFSAYKNEAVIYRDLMEAHFKKVQIEVVKLVGYAKSARTAARGLVRGMPMATGIIERDHDMLPLIENYVSEELATRFGERDLQIPIQARVVVATK